MEHKERPPSQKGRSLVSYNRMIDKKKERVWVYFSKIYSLYLGVFIETFIPIGTIQGLSFGPEVKELEDLTIKPMSRSQLSTIRESLIEYENWVNSNNKLQREDEDYMNVTYHLVISDKEPKEEVS